MRQENYDVLFKRGTWFMTKYAPLCVFFGAKFGICKDLILPITIMWILGLVALLWARFVDRGGILYRVLATFGACIQHIMFIYFHWTVSPLMLIFVCFGLKQRVMDVFSLVFLGRNSLAICTIILELMKKLSIMMYELLLSHFLGVFTSKKTSNTSLMTT